MSGELAGGLSRTGGEEEEEEEEAKTLDFLEVRERVRGILGGKTRERVVGREGLRKRWCFEGDGRERVGELRGKTELGHLRIRV